MSASEDEARDCFVECLSIPSQPLVVEVLRRPIEFTQYTSIRYTERLAEAGIAPSIGSAGDAYDNAMAESTIGLYKTELIHRGGPWRTPEQVEIATLEYIDWWNMRRLHTEIGDIPPAEKEVMYYAEEELPEHAGIVG